MSHRLRAALACALLAPVARPARRPPRRRTDLASLARRRLEQQDREQRAEFDAAGARPLPAKARQRLEETRRAWDEGQGRLLGMLRAHRVAGAPAGWRPRERGGGCRRGAPAPRRIRAASRTEPLSEGELKTRVPGPAAAGARLSPPRRRWPPATSRRSARSRRRSALRAASFSGPIEAYEWVRNAIRPELYHGVMKGPVQTLLESSGNDADTAGLLIALLRAKGIPARYVRGTVDIPAPLAVAVTGTAEPRAGSPRLPARGGARRAVERPRRHRRDPHRARVGRGVRPLRQLPWRGPRQLREGVGSPRPRPEAPRRRRAATTSAPPASTPRRPSTTTSPPRPASRPASSTASGRRRPSPTGGRTSRTRRPSRAGT